MIAIVGRVLLRRCVLHARACRTQSIAISCNFGTYPLLCCVHDLRDRQLQLLLLQLEQSLPICICARL